MAVCGLHFRPNKKSQKGMIEKKRIDSNSTERTMPMVVTMATQEERMSAMFTTRSTLLRARKPGAMRRQAQPKPAPPKATPIASTAACAVDFMLA